MMTTMKSPVSEKEALLSSSPPEIIPPHRASFPDDEEDPPTEMPASNGLDLATNGHLATDPSSTTETTTRSETATSGSWSKILRLTLMFLAVLSAGTVVVLTWLWIHQERLGGGLSSSISATSSSSTTAQVFNWHPLLMTVAFAAMTLAMLAFRFGSGEISCSTTTITTRSATSTTTTTTTTTIIIITRPTMTTDTSSLLPSRIPYRKVLHATHWTLAAGAITVALVAVWASHDRPDHDLANLYSFHSWMALFVLSLAIGQYLLGLVGLSGLCFFSPTSPVKDRLLRPVHVRLGYVLYGAFAVTMLLGLQEKEGFVGCAYPVTTPDYYPWQHAHLRPVACRLSHALGFAVVATTLCTLGALSL